MLPVYRDTPLTVLHKTNRLSRGALMACRAAVPPMETAGDLMRYLATHDNLRAIPGCRRPGLISRELESLGRMVRDTHTPPARPGDIVEEWDFMTATRREQLKEFRAMHGHLPMFAVLHDWCMRPGATRNDNMVARMLTTPSDSPLTLMALAKEYGLSAERVRQIILEYRVPDTFANARLWHPYANHATYFIAETSRAYRDILQREMPTLGFRGYCLIMKTVHPLVSVEGRYLARQGWENEITAWHRRLTRLAQRKATAGVHSRLTVEGLSMGGTLDARLKPIVLTQIAPSLGLDTDADSILL